METKDTLSSCSYSDKQDMQQMLKRVKILKGSCLNGLSALKSNFTQKLEEGVTKSEFERAFRRIFGEDVDTFTRTFSQNMDTLEQQLTKETILESNCQNAFRIQECTVQEVKASDAISEDKVQKRCIVSFRQLHSHLKLLSNNDLNGTRTESGFKRAFVKLFGQDADTFTGIMFLNLDQLEKQLDNKEVQEIGSMAAFKVLETQFQMFFKSRIYLDDEYVVMTRNYFFQYTQLAIPEFRDTLEKVYTSKALDASLVDIESSVTESIEQDTSIRSGNDAHVDDADIIPIYDAEPMAEVHMTAESISLLQDNNILSNLNSIMKERLTRMLNNVMTRVFYLLN
nr:hypothetical protein [Tanacetum cinerariifolium]